MENGEKKKKKVFYGAIKRVLDIIVSLLAIIVLFLPSVVFAIIIKCESKGPVFFKQKRVGKGKKLFTIYKFRTMRTDAPKDTPTHLLGSAQSFITRSGAFMRKTSIDEIPQLINILKGDMSFVGPRPALWNQDDLIAERDKFGANDIMPGLTGWAQINGRDDISIERKAQLDGEYAEKRSLLFDIKIFFGTISAAIKGKNVTDSKAEHTEKLKILVVCQYFYPEAFRINDICKELVQRGHDVTVLTGTPNYPRGKIFDGYEKGKKAHENLDGIDVYRAKIIPRGSGSNIKLVMNYYSFVHSGKRLARKLAREKEFDQVFVYQLSPALMAFPGLLVSKKQKIPMNMYILDLWPDSVAEAGHVKSKFVLSYLNKKLEKIYKGCSKILVSSRSFKELLVKRGCNSEKIVFWPQYPEDYYVPVEKNREDGIFNVMFTGNVGKAQGFEVVAEAAEMLKEHKDIRWTIVGEGRGRKEFEDKVREKGLENAVIFKNRIPSEEVADILADADAALLILKDMPLANITLPAKLQSYLACGKPVIASINGEGANAVAESGAGLVSRAGDAGGLAENVLKMYEMTPEERKILGKNAENYCKDVYSKEKLMDYLIEEMQKEMTEREERER